MCNSAIAAFAITNILRSTLLQLAPALFQHRRTTLISTSLVSRKWYQISKEEFARVLVFHLGTAQMVQWNRWNWSEERSDTTELAFVDQEGPERGASWNYDMIRTILSKVTGVRYLTIGFKGYNYLDPMWFESNSLADLRQLTLKTPIGPSPGSVIPPFSLTILRLEEPNLIILRDWRHTCSILSRSTIRLKFMKITGFQTHTIAPIESTSFQRYLAPDFPLAADLRESSHGSLLPLAASLETMIVPGIPPAKNSFNLAVFGAGAPNLKRLIIDLVTAESYSTVQLFRFFPRLHELRIRKCISLVFADSLPPARKKQFNNLGMGDVIKELVDVIQKEGLPELRIFAMDMWKYFEKEQLERLVKVLTERGIEFRTLYGEEELSDDAEIEHYRNLAAEITLYEEAQALEDQSFSS